MKDFLIKKAIMALAVLFLLTTDAYAVAVKHHFDAIIGLFNASEADFTYSVDTAKYAVNSNISTKGLFDTLYPFAAEYSTSGKFDAGRMVTENYSYESQSRFTNRTKKVVYQNGIPLQSITTKNGKKKVKQIKKRNDVDNTTDLQSVMAAMAEQYTKKQDCNAVKKVFDGKRRYNVIFKDLGQEELEESELSPFFGKAIKCSMYIDRLKEHGNDMLWKMTSESPVYFWIMNDKETNVPFIARVKVNDTPLGDLTVYTTNIEVQK